MAGNACSLNPGQLKSTPFQLFDIHGKTIAVPLQKSDLIAPFAKENKDITAHRIRAKFIADKPGKGVDSKTHICGLTIKIIATGT